MREEKLQKDLLGKIGKNSNIAIFGAGIVAEKMLNDFKLKRPDVNVKFFIDTKYEGELAGLKVYSPLNCKNLIKDVDKIVFSTRRDVNKNFTIMKYLGAECILESRFVEFYYRDEENLFSAKNFDTISDILETSEDKKLFELLFKVRTYEKLNIVELMNYTKEKYDISADTCYFDVFVQYLDKINKDKIQVVYDLGFWDGSNVLAWERSIKNLKKVYAFEPIYDLTKDELVDTLLQEIDKLEIIPFAVSDKEGECTFMLNQHSLAGSALKDISSKHIDNHYIERTVKMTSIDNYFENNDILPPDLIKMDIEGAELPALKGAINTIKKFRPQLAISIYHSKEDFIQIPLFLKENLTDYIFKIGHYCPDTRETVFYAIPIEIKN